MSAVEPGRGVGAGGGLPASKPGFRRTSRLVAATASAALNLAALSGLPAARGLPGAPAPARAGELAVRGEAGFAASVTSARIHRFALESRVELHGRFDPAGPPGAGEWHIAANPALRWNVTEGSLLSRGAWQIAAEPWDPALEEAYLAVRWGAWVASAGRERLPLEVARLGLPFSVEPVAPGGLRLGRWGARIVGSSRATRLRVAALEEAGRVLSALSLRWQAGALELEGHALLTGEGLQVTAGATASGLVRQVVVYGEVWHVPEWRFVGGLSGFWKGALWTMEGGRAMPASGQPVRWLIAAQLAWQQDASRAWSLTQYAFFDPDGMRAQLAVGQTLAAGSHDARLFVSLNLGPEPPSWSAGATYRLYWGSGRF